MVPKGMIVDLSSISDLEKFINKFTNANWNNILSHFKSDIAQEIIVLLNQKKMIESSFGINLVEQCGFRFPGVIIPILSVITTFLSSYFMLKSNDVNDKETIMQQRIMLIFMPLMMGFISLSLSAGVGVYWIVNSVIQLIQQFFANKCRNDYGGKKISV
jgi:YidC/Oxa1 family membrane protein insertase